MADSEQTKPKVGLYSIVNLTIANMIGASLFTTSAFTLRDLGNKPLVMLAWFLGGVIALMGAISYGQLARRITESGGEYLYLSRMVHPVAGFMAGWVSLFAGFSGATAYAAVTFSVYALGDGDAPDWASPLLSMVVVLGFAILHALVRTTGLITQNIIVALKIIGLAIFVLFAIWHFPGVASSEGRWSFGDKAQPVPFSIGVFASTLVWISLAYTGYNASIYMSEEVNNARVNVPRAMIIGTLLVTGIYLLMNFIFLYATPANVILDSKNDIAALAARSLSPGLLEYLVRMVVCLAMLSSVSSLLLVGPRVYAKMANEGVFPKVFSFDPSRSAAPSFSIFLQAILTCLLIQFATLKGLLDYLGLTLSVCSALTVAALLFSKPLSTGEGEQRWRTLVAGAFVIVTLGLAVLGAAQDIWKWVGLLATIVIGISVYAVWKVTENRRRPIG